MQSLLKKFLRSFRVRDSLLAASAAVLLASGTALAQFSIPAYSTPLTIDFTGFAGAGFQPNPTAEQLDSETWAVTGWSDGDLAFGGTRTTVNTDYTRGLTPGPVSIAGIYAFDLGGVNRALGIQPGGSDWAPGALTLRIVNDGGSTITSLSVSYNLFVRNDQGRASSFNFSYSSNDTSYTSVPALNFTSGGAADTFGLALSFSPSTTISGLSVGPGQFFYIRWTGADVGGSGSRDEFGLDDIMLSATGLLGDYNQDNVVNAADYVVWRKAATLGIADLPNDNDDNGPVGTTEFNLWRANFGTGSPGGGLSGVAPEPNSAALLVFAIVAILGGCFRRQR